MVFWMQQDAVFGDRQMRASGAHFEMNEMQQALAFMADLRKKDTTQFVTMVSQNSNSVGRPGVDSVVDGKTPDGQEYDWSKAGRAGAMRKSDRLVTKTE